MWPFARKEVSLFRKVQPDATLPVRGTTYSAGHDLHSQTDGCVLSGETVVVPTGIGWSNEVADDWYGHIVERSGHAIRNGVITLGGIIDCDYEDEFMVILHNTGKDTFRFHKGDRIAQLLVGSYKSLDKPSKVRVGGFGSTGR